MAKIHIENGIISSSADYGLYHGTSEIAKVEAGGLRVQGDVTAENLIVSSSVTYMTQSFSSGSTIFGDSSDDTHVFTGSLSVNEGTLTLEKSPAALSWTPNASEMLVLKRHASSGAFAGITLQSGGAGKSFINFGDTANNDQGQIAYNNATDAFEIKANDTKVLDITSTKISGSATSTGSFGRLVVGRGSTDSTYSSTTGGDIVFGVNAPGKRVSLYATHVEIGPSDPFGGNLFTKDGDASLFVQTGIHIFTSGNNQGMRIYNTYGSAYNSYVERGGNSWLGTAQDGGHLVLRNFGSGGTQVWHGSNVVVDVKASATGSSTLLTLEDNKISGSSTSTGSFGKLIVDDARFKDDIFIGSSGTSGFRDGSDSNISVYIANTQRFKWYNNAGNIYFGSNNASGPNIYSAASSTTNATYRISGVTNTGWGGGTDKISGIIGGTEVLQIAANKISGSSTSTGSFGQAFIDSQLEIGKALTSTTTPSIIINDNPSYRGEIGYSQASNTTFFFDNTYNNDNAQTQFRTGGSAKMIIRGNGGVGIGTSPAMSYAVGLHIKNASNVVNLKLHSGGGYGFDLWQDTGGTAYLINHDNAKIQFITNHNASSTIGMEIKANGNIEFPSASTISGSSTSTGSFGAGYIDNKLGIGTLVPTENLHVVGELAVEETSAKSGKIKFRDTDQAVLGQIGIARTTNDIGSNSANLDMVYRLEYNNKFMWNQQNTTRMVLTSTGLGIGTTNPGYPLEVYSAGSSIEARVVRGNGAGLTISAGGSTGAFGTTTNHDLELITNFDSYSANNVVLITSGSVSGSATSTGSFGRVMGLTSGGKFGNISVGPRNAEDTIRRNSGDLYLQYNAGASSKVRIGHTSKTIIDDTVISGSATSTGSFGNVHVVGRLGIGTTNTFEPVVAYPDQDIKAVFGRVVLHSVSSDTAMFSHYDNRNSSAAYALRQDSTGTTTINAKTGKKILFGINNQYKMTVSGDNVGIGTTDPDEKLHVVGNIFATGNISGSSTSTGSFGHGYFNDRIDIHSNLQALGAGDAMALRAGNGHISIENGYDLYLRRNGGAVNFNSIGLPSGVTYGYIKMPSDTQMDFYAGNGVKLSLTQDNKISGSATSTGSFGQLQIQPDTDSGFAKIGRTFIGTTHSDHAGFSHVDQALSSGGYALVQSSGGITALNAASGQKINFNINNSNIGLINSSGLEITSGNISGSSSSTGSFGTLRSTQRLTLDVPAGSPAAGGSTTRGLIDINHTQSGGDAHLLTFNSLNSHFYIMSDQGRMKFYSSPSPSYDGTGQAGFMIMADMDDDGTYLSVGNGNLSNIPLQVKPNMISGSAATTGSFGSVHIADRLGIGTTSTFEPVVAYPDENVMAIFGKAVLRGSSDLLYISHYDRRHDGVSYALRQAANGQTNINAASGEDLNLSINNDTIVKVNTHGLGIGATPTNNNRLMVKADGNDDGISLFDASDNRIFKVFQQTTDVGRMLLRGNGQNVVDLGDGADESFIDVGQLGIGVRSSLGAELDVSGSIQLNGNFGNETFTTGFGGAGFRIGKDATNLYEGEFDNLFVRGRMTVFELLINQIRASNGAVYVSDAAKVESVTPVNATTFKLNFDTGSGYGHPFQANDLLKAQRFNGSGVYVSRMTVTGIAGTNGLTASLQGGDTPPSGGFEFVRVGNTNDTDRQGAIYLTNSDNGAPFMDVYDGVTSHVFPTGSQYLKVRVGKLDGVSSPTFTIPDNTYGFYASGSVFLEGSVNATSGSIGSFIIDNTEIKDKEGTADLRLKSSGQITGSKVLFDGGKVGGFDINDISISDADKNLVISSSGQITGSKVLFTNGNIGGFALDAHSLTTTGVEINDITHTTSINNNNYKVSHTGHKTTSNDKLRG